jgi:hypothetical protein
MKRSLFVLALFMSLTVPTWAQVQPGSTSEPALSDQRHDDSAIHPAEPDFTIISLPTALRLPLFGSAFRVTHRFTRPLNDDFGDVAADLFGLDSGAQIGLEYRLGIVRNGQVGIHRTSDKTIEFFGQYGVLRQTPRRWVDVTAMFSIDGTNNFRDQYSPAVGAIVSRRFDERAALYIEPIWVHHSNVQPASAGEADDTLMMGLGGRVRVRPSISIAAEFSPRTSGYRPGVSHASFAIEKRVGGHVFQLNFSDSFATTVAQVARGGPAAKDWFLGFNISRKFF